MCAYECAVFVALATVVDGIRAVRTTVDDFPDGVSATTRPLAREQRWESDAGATRADDVDMDNIIAFGDVCATRGGRETRSAEERVRRKRSSARAACVVDGRRRAGVWGRGGAMGRF